MWFLFGFITLAAACVWSLIWRLSAAWHGSAETTGGIAYEYAASVVKSKVQLIRVGVACGAGFTFTLKPEGGFDRLSKSIGLTKECQTGDAAFDDAIYVLSDDLALHRMLQLDAKLRANITRLTAACNVEGELKSINAHNGRLWVVVDPITNDKSEAAQVARRIVPALDHLSCDFTVKNGPVRDARDPFPFRAACLLAVSTGLAINGGFAIVRGTSGTFPFMVDLHAPARWALLVALGALSLLVAIALAWMGRSACTHLVLVELVLVGSLGAYVTAYAEFRDYNIELDRAPPRMIEASVTRLYDTYTHHKGQETRHCHVEMRGWPIPESWASQEVDCGFQAQLSVGGRVVVEQHQGALGWPWVAAFYAR